MTSDFDFLNDPEPSNPKLPGPISAAGDPLGFLGDPIREVKVEQASLAPPQPLSPLIPSQSAPIPDRPSAWLEMELTGGGAWPLPPVFEALPVPLDAREYRSGLKELGRRQAVLDDVVKTAGWELHNSVPLAQRETARADFPIIREELKYAKRQSQYCARSLASTRLVFFANRRELRAQSDELVEKQRGLQVEFETAHNLSMRPAREDMEEWLRRSKLAAGAHRLIADEYKLKYSFLDGGGGGGVGALSDAEEAAARVAWYEAQRQRRGEK